MSERRLPGGHDQGAVVVGGTVRRAGGPWTPAVHALLRHLSQRGFQGAPVPLGFDAQGREVVSFLPGATVGDQRPWPGWVHSDDALREVGDWVRRYHDALTDFVPPVDAHWRIDSRTWRPGDVVGHNDAGPYNAVWEPGPPARLIGFVDWDFAGPCSRIEDLAFLAFSWVPLHARRVVAAEGFTDFGARSRRLRILLDAYGFSGTVTDLLDAVASRIDQHIQDVRALAAAGDNLFQHLVAAGATDGLAEALSELERDRHDLHGL
ncbi:phosphotransferase [Nakamurella sp.]|uniref:phosphotransferase n=1 Tax=Nakamurella sp. TaxID=1869182 RepID=UPI0037850176